MRVRLRLTPHKDWLVESKCWHEIFWQYEGLFSGDDAYDRAHSYAVALKNPLIEEIK